jgi:hypothetical protein
MEVSMLFETLKLALLGFLVSLLVIFILLNFMLGCGDWGAPNCVTPIQFIEILTSPFTK